MLAVALIARSRCDRSRLARERVRPDRFKAIAGWPVLMFGLLVLSAIGATRGFASPSEAATEQVRVRLLSSLDSVYPGAELLLGLEQKIIPHWHTYWKNPGDSGLATSIDWRLPSGASAGPILWPVPSRVSLGPVTNFAYSDEVTLLSSVKVPADARVGTEFALSAHIKWLVCEEICIPQEADLGLSLPIVAERTSAGSQAKLIDQALARLPVASSWTTSVEVLQGGLRLSLAAPELRSSRIRKLEFFPDQWGKINHGASQPWSTTEAGIVLELGKGEAPLIAGEDLAGVLAVTESGPAGPITHGFELRAPVHVAETSPQEPSKPVFLSALALAWLGGLILNLMPCVFPVLSLKALHLLAHAEESPGVARRQGWAYTGGVLVSFAALAAVLLALKAGGSAVGWGFQFQSPLFVLLTAYLMFTVGLSLSGGLTVGTSIAGLGSSLGARNAYTESFFTGVLASVVAAPCTAPFMGAAIGYAVAQPAPILVAVFLALGFGLATPYLALSHWPRLQHVLPRPGRWMETLRQGLAFPMYATAIWLVWVLAQQAGVDAAALALAGMLAIGFASWVRERMREGDAPTRWLANSFAVSLLILAVLAGQRGVNHGIVDRAQTAGDSASAGWEAYSPERFRDLRSEGAPVFLNFTAAWCISCLVNERVALAVPSVAEVFRRQGIHYLKGDWTQRDPAITAKLAEFGRSGVPLYVFYPRGVGSTPEVLPQILTPEIVVSRLSAPGVSTDSSLSFKE